EVTARTYPIVAWKTFTHFPAAFEHDGNGWYLDDRDRPDDPIAEPFIRKAVELDLPTICIHKGLSLGSPFATPDDVGPAAARPPDELDPQGALPRESLRPPGRRRPRGRPTPRRELRRVPLGLRTGGSR